MYLAVVEYGVDMLNESIMHIGHIIEEELRRQERSVTWLADKISCERTNVYSIFKRDSIDTQLLVRISLALRHNFFVYYLKELENRGFYSTQP